MAIFSLSSLTGFQKILLLVIAVITVLCIGAVSIRIPKGALNRSASTGAITAPRRDSHSVRLRDANATSGAPLPRSGAPLPRSGSRARSINSVDDLGTIATGRPRSYPESRAYRAANEQLASIPAVANPGRRPTHRQLEQLG